MAESMILVPVRTSRQGASLNAGKLKSEYRDETSTVELHVDDMARLGLKKGDSIRMRSPGGSEAIVSCKERKSADSEPGMIFMAYGPVSSQFMEDGDTAGSGMPISKHLAIEVEGPLAPDGSVLVAGRVPGALAPAAGQIGSPLSAEQAGLLGALAGSSLNSIQAAWLSGYFAALSGAQGVAPALNMGNMGLAAPQPAAAASTLPLMTILFGSQTGNGEGLAHQLQEQAAAKGFNARVQDMSDYSPASIVSEKLLFVIVSTHGEGDPPVAAEELHAYLKGDDAPRLENLQYAVFALGDTSYEQFCQTGKDFDAFLERLGAKRVMDRVDSDVDFEEPGAEWIGKVLDTYQSIAGESGAAVKTSAEVLEFPSKDKSKFSKSNPYPGTILRSVNLSGEGSAKQNQHIEIDFGDSGLSYEPGDALGVYPVNNPAYVDDLLKALNYDAAETVTVGKESVELREALLSKLDITGLSRVLVEKYAELVGSEDLKTLLDDAHTEDFKEYCWGRQIIDLVEDAPPIGIAPQEFVDVLRKMPGRLYSIASSMKKHKNQAQLLVGAVRYHSFDRDREGVCSTFLGGRVGEGEKLLIYVQPNKVFRLPDNPDVPVIMVGPGTGVAPFRAFLQERESTGAKGKNWLFFGDQHKATDFVYEDEWEEMQQSGILTRMHAAFSRDQAEKIYVQNLMLDNAAEIYAWLEEGAHFYVCGDAARMAGDVHKALISIIGNEGGRTPEEAESYIKAMEKAKRYQRDVY
ncbi:MAG: assimilatory sulfite reductase (NADPH) flavoprotein subunit [Gammaproteobacteria bacterium]